MNERKLTPMDMYELCNEQKWFTCGTNSQYEKMFDFVRNNEITCGNSYLIQRLSTIIWICSENVEENHIYIVIEKLLQAKSYDY